MVRDIRLMTLALAAVLTVGPSFAQIDAEGARAIAWAAALEQEPELDSPETRSSTKTSDQVVLFDVSDPFSFNGEIFWRTYRWYEYTAGAVTRLTGIGTARIEDTATAPLPALVPDSLRSKTLEWLSFWDARTGLDPNLKIGAQTSTVYLFHFYQDIMGPRAAIGVDNAGRTFRLNPENPLFPWRDAAQKRAQARFDALHAQP